MYRRIPYKNLTGKYVSLVIKTMILHIHVERLNMNDNRQYTLLTHCINK